MIHMTSQISVEKVLYSINDIEAYLLNKDEKGSYIFPHLSHKINSK